MNNRPTDWDDVALDDFGEIIAGGTPSRAAPSFWNGDIPWVTPSEITTLKNKYLRVTREQITREGLASSAAKLLPSGTLLVTSRATLGEVAIAGVSVSTNQGFKNIIPNEETDPLFAYYQIRTLKPQIERCASGTTFLEISKADFSRIRTLRPSRAEQSRIAAILDTVDEAIAKTEAVIAKLKQVRAGLLHDLLTRGLDENGQLRDPIAHPEQFQDSPIGRIPRGWFYEPLVKHTVSSAYGPRFSGECYSERGNIALVRTTDMDETGNLALENMPLADLILDEFRSHFLEVGDFLISRSGTCGIGSVFPGFRVPVLPGAFLIRFRLAATLFPEFLRLYVNSEAGAKRISDLAEGGVQKNIRGSTLLTHLIPIPPTTEQQAILDCVRSIDVKTAVEQAGCGKLQQLKSALMTDLLTGRVRVPADIVP